MSKQPPSPTINKTLTAAKMTDSGLLSDALRADIGDAPIDGSLVHKFIDHFRQLEIANPNTSIRAICIHGILDEAQPNAPALVVSLHLGNLFSHYNQVLAAHEILTNELAHAYGAYVAADRIDEWNATSDAIKTHVATLINTLNKWTEDFPEQAKQFKSMPTELSQKVQ